VNKERTTNLTLQLSVVLVKSQTSKRIHFSQLFYGVHMKCGLSVKVLSHMVYEVFLFLICWLQKVLN
jgi:hypothetical protein